MRTAGRNHEELASADLCFKVYASSSAALQSSTEPANGVSECPLWRGAKGWAGSAGIETNRASGGSIARGSPSLMKGRCRSSSRRSSWRSVGPCPTRCGRSISRKAAVAPFKAREGGADSFALLMLRCLDPAQRSRQQRSALGRRPAVIQLETPRVEALPDLVRSRRSAL